MLARQSYCSSLSLMKSSTPPNATATPSTWLRCSGVPLSTRSRMSVITGPHAMMSAVENAVDQWMP